MMNKIDKHNVEDIVSMSATQLEFLYHYLNEPGNHLYHSKVVIELSGFMQMGLFEKALKYVVEQNETLRSVFQWEKLTHPLQIVLRKAQPDLVLTEEENTNNNISAANNEGNTSEPAFDLRKTPFRVVLVRKAPQDYTLIIYHHHILYDGWSTGIIIRELLLAYSAMVKGEMPASFPKLKLRNHYLLNQRRKSGDEQAKAYWGSYLKEYPTKRLINNNSATLNANIRRVHMAYSLQKLERFCSIFRLTMATVLYAAFGIVLRKYLDTDDIVLGTTVSTRNSHTAARELVGLFINTCPLRFNSAATDKIIDLLNVTYHTLIERKDYEYMPEHEIKKVIGLKANEELFNAIISIENYPLDIALLNDTSDCKVIRYTYQDQAHYPLSVIVSFNNEAADIAFNYNEAVLQECFSERFHQHFMNVLDEIITDPFKKVAEPEGNIVYPGRLDDQEKTTGTPVLWREPELTAYVASRNAIEYTLTTVWQEVLNVKQIGIRDNFFLIGGDSIRSIQIASRLLKYGYRVTVKDIFNNPTIASLSLIVKKAQAIQVGKAVKGPMGLTPIQHWFFGQHQAYRHHFNQSVLLEFKEQVDSAVMREIIGGLQNHHDALRTVFCFREGQIIPENRGLDQPVSLTEYVCEQNDEDALKERGGALQGSLDLSAGPLLKAALFQMGQAGSRLLLIIHHLVVDAISWRVLLEDLNALYAAYLQGIKKTLPPVGATYRQWSDYLVKYAESHDHCSSHSYWDKLLKAPHDSVQADNYAGSNRMADVSAVTFSLGEDDTHALLTEVHHAFGTQVNDILLSGLLLGLHQRENINRLLIDMEGHGREEVAGAIDINRTIGWFTSIYPVLLGVGATTGETIKQVKEHLHRVPGKGIDYGVYRYLSGEKNSLEENRNRQILFNYLGQFDSDLSGKLFKVLSERHDNQVSPDHVRDYELEIIAFVKHNRLQVWFHYSHEQYNALHIEAIAGSYKHGLEEVIAYCRKRRERVKTPVDFSYDRLSIAQVDRLTSQHLITGIYELSPMQEGMYFHYLMDRNDQTYFEQVSYRVEGEVNITLLERSLNDLVDRYDVLRTMFVHEGYDCPLQMVLAEGNVYFDYQDLRYSYENGGKEQLIEAGIEKDKQKKFRLDKAEVMRLTLLRTGATEYVFIWSFHHIIMDGWCMGILIKEFMQCYYGRVEGKPAVLPPAGNYSGYIEWLRKLDHKRARDYWEQYLSGYEQVIRVGNEAQQAGRQDKERQWTVKEQMMVLDKDMVRQIQEFCTEREITRNALLQALWGILLGWYNTTGDVVFGLVVAGRPAEVEEVEKMVGLFVNTIPVRVSFSGEDTVGNVAAGLQASLLAGTEHCYYPLSGMQEITGRQLLNHVMAFEDYPVSEELEQIYRGETLGESLQVKDVRMFERNSYDFSVLVLPGASIRIVFRYIAEAYEDVQVKDVMAHYGHLLKQALDFPQAKIKEIVLLLPEEQQLLQVFNNTLTDYPANKTIHSFFEEQAGKTPDRVALIYEDVQLTYQELNKLSDELAVRLQSAGVGPDSLVGIMVDRSPEMIIGILGILKSGGAYMPVDPVYPEERVSYMIEDSEIKILLVCQPYMGRSKGLCKEINISDRNGDTATNHRPVRIATAENLAYVIYTSGSTGLPKGVQIEHHAVVNRLIWMQKEYPIGHEDVLIQKTPFSFDVSVWEICWWFIAGSRLVVLRNGAEKDPELLLHHINKEQVSTIHFVPSMLRIFLDHTDYKGHINMLASLRRVFSSGEELTKDLVKKCKEKLNAQHGTRLINLYGPTEATVDVSYYNCFEEEQLSVIPIGRPINNTALYVMDQYGRVLPVGVCGELCISGVGLARGYLNKRELTLERFIPSPFQNGERLYRTGDLAKWLPDGNIVYLGRIDDQVKIRGYRVEPGEIVHWMLRYPGIMEAAAVFCNPGDGNAVLAGYYVSEMALETVALKHYLLSVLPDYMVPVYFVWMKSFPLLPNGKLDKRSLPAPWEQETIAYIAPGNDVEETLAVIWEDILGVPKSKISTRKSFFEMGGHSLKVIILKSRVQMAFNVDVKLTQFFEINTIEKLANVVALAKMLPLDAGMETDNKLIII